MRLGSSSHVFIVQGGAEKISSLLNACGTMLQKDTPGSSATGCEKAQNGLNEGLHKQSTQQRGGCWQGTAKYCTRPLGPLEGGAHGRTFEPVRGDVLFAARASRTIHKDVPPANMLLFRRTHTLQSE